MAKTIAVALQKGGVGKSTLSAVLAYGLHQRGKRVLVVDLDGQCNVTQLLTGAEDAYENSEIPNIYEALVTENASDNIVEINELDGFDALIGSENIFNLSSHFYMELEKNNISRQHTLRRTLEPVKDDYDYIILDCPPALGDIMLNALTAADGVIVPFETSKFSMSALTSFLGTVAAVKRSSNPDIDLYGILRTMLDRRAKDNHYYAELVKKQYEDAVFDTIISRRAVVGRMSTFGVFEYNDMNEVIEIYKPFIEELMEIVEEPAVQ